MKLLKKFTAFLRNAADSIRSVFKRKNKTMKMPVYFVWTPSMRIHINRELPSGRATRSSVHALTDANKQLELIRMTYDPAFPRYAPWTHGNFTIRNWEYLDRQDEKRIGRQNFRNFDKEKFKPEPHSQKIMDEQYARRKRRPQSIQAADGALCIGAFPSRLSQSSFIVENGVWPEEDIQSYKSPAKSKT